MDRFVPFVLIPIIAWGVRRYLIAHHGYSRLKKLTLAIGISAWFLTEIAPSFYRPYIYANDISDWVVADTVGNSLGTITAVFMILTLSGRGSSRDWWLVGMVIAGLIGYEMLNLFSEHPFDLNDVLATLIFGAISVAVYARTLARHGTAAGRSEPISKP